MPRTHERRLATRTKFREVVQSGGKERRDAFKSCKATLSLLNRRDRKALEIFRAAIFYGMPLADAWRLVETDELNAALANEVDSRRVSQ